MDDIAQTILSDMNENGFLSPGINDVDDKKKTEVNNRDASVICASQAIIYYSKFIEAVRKGKNDSQAELFDLSAKMNDCLTAAIASLTERQKFVTNARGVAVGKVGLFAEEVGECMYEVAKDGDLDHDAIQEELADIIIRVLHFAASLGYSMDSAVEMKCEINRGRGKRHGKCASI